MRRSNFHRAAALAVLVVAAVSTAHALSGSGDPDEGPQDPTLPFGTLKPRTNAGSPAVRSNPGVTAPLVAPPPTDKNASRPAPPNQSDQLDELFGRLAKAADATEASSIALLIQHLWLQSGSDTADLLMVRAVTAVGKGNTTLATELLDKIIVIDPAWAEAWNKRATLRFLANDDDGAMQDIAHVLTIEPRHFGALSGMSFILQRHGMKKEALALLRRTGSIYPYNTELEKMKDALSIEVEGREL